ncbi:MAG: hypothetical protein DRP01_09350 [Archaeoglobales archaeon]|nr:MAG: hypothetical protein DRP01_09350 [Archaeoglobales archaeon]
MSELPPWPYFPRKFPHLKLVERYIATKWVMDERIPDSQLKWDVKLYVPLPEHVKRLLTPEELRMTQELTAKRIDCVWEKENEIVIVEVKDKVRHSALGQLLAYRDMYIEQYKPRKPVRMLLVCGADDPPVRKVLEKYGIEVKVVYSPESFARLLKHLKAV